MIAAIANQEPRIGTSKRNIDEPISTATSTTSRTIRERRYESKYSARDIGVAMSRLRRCFRRWSTMGNPSPQMPPPMMFMPSRPGITKSM
jgi:hypothetical protein